LCASVPVQRTTRADGTQRRFYNTMHPYLLFPFPHSILYISCRSVSSNSSSKASSTAPLPPSPPSLASSRPSSTTLAAAGGAKGAWPSMKRVIMSRAASGWSMGTRWPAKEGGREGMSSEQRPALAGHPPSLHSFLLPLFQFLPFTSLPAPATTASESKPYRCTHPTCCGAFSSPSPLSSSSRYHRVRLAWR